MRGGLLAGAAIALVAGTFAYASAHRFTPHMHGSPVAAVVELKKLNLTRVFNDYDFGGYLIANEIQPSSTAVPNSMARKSSWITSALPPVHDPEDYKIEATLTRTESAPNRLLDHVDGWRRVYSDDIATLHVRAPGASRIRSSRR